MGHYCPEGSTAPIRCLSGTYQDETHQVECKPCPPGYFCDNTIQPVVLYNDSSCPTGFYCPQSTERANQYPCPVGTFNNLTNRVAVSDCQDCLGGMYCDQIGLTEPTGMCAAGYVCLSGANSSTPNADSCPEGFFCPEGTSVPVSCPPGTYNPSMGRQSEDECTNCTGGHYCPTTAMINVGPQCSAGSFIYYKCLELFFCVRCIIKHISMSIICYHYKI